MQLEIRIKYKPQCAASIIYTRRVMACWWSLIMAVRCGIMRWLPAINISTAQLLSFAKPVAIFWAPYCSYLLAKCVAITWSFAIGWGQDTLIILLLIGHFDKEIIVFVRTNRQNDSEAHWGILNVGGDCPNLIPLKWEVPFSFGVKLTSLCLDIYDTAQNNAIISVSGFCLILIKVTSILQLIY